MPTRAERDDSVAIQKDTDSPMSDHEQRAPRRRLLPTARKHRDVARRAPTVHIARRVVWNNEYYSHVISLLHLSSTQELNIRCQLFRPHRMKSVDHMYRIEPFLLLRLIIYHESWYMCFGLGWCDRSLAERKERRVDRVI